MAGEGDRPRKRKQEPSEEVKRQRAKLREERDEFRKASARIGAASHSTAGETSNEPIYRWAIKKSQLDILEAHWNQRAGDYSWTVDADILEEITAELNALGLEAQPLGRTKIYNFYQRKKDQLKKQGVNIPRMRAPRKKPAAAVAKSAAQPLTITAPERQTTAPPVATTTPAEAQADSQAEAAQTQQVRSAAALTKAALTAEEGDSSIWEPGTEVPEIPADGPELPYDLELPYEDLRYH